MSSTIKPKFDQRIQRQVSQATAERKSELTARHVDELKSLGKSIKESNEAKRAMSNSLHAVNHIKTRAVESETDEEGIETTPYPESKSLYTRQGKRDLVEKENDDVTPNEIESAEARIARHKDEKFEKKQADDLAQADDEFYHVKDRGNVMTEDTTGYYIEAYAPEHEKSGVRVSVLNDKAIISGSRKAQNEEEHSRGKVVTNNFQTFREEFDLGTPVTSKGMTREREGDYIRFFIPKLGSEVDSEDGSTES